MPKDKKHNKPTDFHLFRRYINREMSAGEEHAFERHLLNDDFESEALEGLSSLSDMDLDSDMHQLSKQIKKPVIPVWRRPAFAGAASIVIIVGVIYVLWYAVPHSKKIVSQSIPATENVKKEVMPVAKELLEETDESDDIEHDAYKLKAENADVADDNEYEVFESESVKEEVSDIKMSKKKLKEPVRSYNKETEPTRVENDKKVTALSQVEKQDEILLTYSSEESSIRHDGIKNNDSVIQRKSVTMIAGIATDDTNRIIHGKVTDSSGEPIPGANVIIKGTTQGAISEIDGNYQITVVSNDTGKILLVGFIGYESQEVAMGGSDTHNFILKEEALALNEVVAIGYGSKRSKGDISEYVPARPEGGMRKYIRELEKNIIYPSEGTGKKELVVALVTISGDGNVKDVKIKRSPGNEYSTEAIRVIKEEGKWTPATNNGINVEDEVRLKLSFIPYED